MEAREVQVVTLRVPREEYQALKSFAQLTGASINDVGLRAIREFLAGEARQDEFEAVLQEARAQYRVALDKLADM